MDEVTQPPPSPASSRADLPGGDLARNAFHLGIGQVLTTALGVVLSAALGRSLGAADFGLFFLVSQMAAVAYVVVGWGQDQFVVREVARHPEKSGDLLGTMLALRTVGAVVMAAATAASALLLGYDPRTAALAALLVGTMLPFFLAQAFGLVFKGRERMGYDAALTVLNKGLTLAFTLMAFMLGGQLSDAILAIGGAGVLSVGLAMLLLGRFRVPRLRIRREQAREILHGGAPLLILGVTITAQGYLEAVVLSKLAPPASVGWYGAARHVLGTLVAPALIIGAAAFPRLSRTAGDPVRFPREVHAAVRPLLGLSVLGAVGTFLFADAAIALIFGDVHFEPAGAILKVGGLAFILLFVDNVLGSAVVAVGKSKAFAVAKVGNVVASTGLAILLVPICEARYGNGGIGLMAAFGASEVIMFAAAVKLLPRGSLPPGLLLDAGRSLVAGAGTALVFLLLPELPVLVGAPLCVLVFGALAMAVGLLRRRDMAAFAAALRRSPAPASGGAAAST